ncbi:MAG: M23 family metallopeptidase [Bacilli bacterium]|nr:M23 family metallopeptidase [Bacilli bacterium]
MKNRRLKGFVLPTFSAFLVSILFITIISLGKNQTEEVNDKVDYTYSNESIVSNTLPVLNEDDVIIRPYQAEKINIYKKFYDGENNTDNAIIYYKDTYMQNSGILYNNDEEFNVVSILDGEVIEVKKEDLLGYVVEIKHSNNLISSYEGLKSVNVKKGDRITQETLIGKSGEISLDVNLKNALLFELIKDGKYVNPENYFDKKANEI